MLRGIGRHARALPIHFGRATGPTATAASYTPQQLSHAAFVRWLTSRADVRNIAVIAHVDHGKTTLVDSLLKQSGTMSNAKGRVMDSKDQEKERGITILAKNTAIVFSDNRRINIVDTPGHLDFSGEVERALQMVEGFILLVDAAEGVKPGTRYVLRKALNLNLKPIIVVNKIDKDGSKVDKVREEVEMLFLETATDADQLDLHFMYGSGRDGYINDEVKTGGTLQPLFDNVFSRIPAPQQPKDESPLQMLVASIDEDPVSKMKIAIGRIFRGSIALEQTVTVVLNGQKVNALVKQIRTFVGVDKQVVKEASFGDVVALTLQEPIEQKVPLVIGASICDPKAIDPWPYQQPDEPTFSLVIQESKASWKEKETTESRLGRMVEIRNRLKREAMVNTALKLEGVETDQIRMLGRGPLHLGVIIEDMRREGFEFELQAPSVMTQMIDGVKHEPWEKVMLEFTDAMTGPVLNMLMQRHAEIGDTRQLSNERTVIECLLPVRSMMNLPLEFNRMTQGDGVLNHSAEGFRPAAAIVTERENGALVAQETGEVTSYALSGLAKHGRFFVAPGDDVYYGQIIGENLGVKFQDIPVNVTKRNEQLGGMRANANDNASKRKGTASSVTMGLEDAMSWVHPAELITVTPKSVRIRKPNFNGKTSNRLRAKENMM